MWGIWLICLLLRYGRILVIKYGKILEINVQWLTLKGTCTKGKYERKYFMREREREVQPYRDIYKWISGAAIS